MHACKRCARRSLNLLVITFLLLVSSAANASVVQAKAPAVYQNPLTLQTKEGKAVESCADPSVIRGSASGDSAWYLYCTTDPLRGDDRDSSGHLIFHLIPMYKSTDLVNWTYQGDVFSARPGWVADDAGLWAPDIEYFNNQYYLYFTASDTKPKGGGSAIGVATSNSPTGPWIDSGAPAVEPHAPPCCPNDRRWVFDPAIVTDGGQRYIYYGSYFGGISARKLSADGLLSDPASQVQITIANRYEGAYIRKHDGYYYLFASATNCCNGPLTGYSVFAGRSQNPLGPFVDRDGVSLLAGRVGGTPVISMNGNRWVGPGHNAIVTDLAGQDWFVYHAVDSNDPYFAGEVGFTKRPVLLDRLDWIDGWPTVRAERWASDTPQPMPVTQPGKQNNAITQSNNALGVAPAGKEPKPLPQFSDEFNTISLNKQWAWVRQPAAGTFGLENGAFRFDTQAADLYVDSNNASVLTEAAPPQDYVVEARVKLNVPAEGCCQNFVQAGLVIYGNDDNFIKLAHVSIWETRQTEFAKELSPVPSDYPRYGNTVVGAPNEWTYLRIVRHSQGNQELYTAYTSRNGITWVHGGAWTHQLGNQAKIGLVSMGGSGFTANFDYVRVYHVRGQAGGPDGWEPAADTPDN